MEFSSDHRRRAGASLRTPGLYERQGERYAFVLALGGSDNGGQLDKQSTREKVGVERLIYPVSRSITKRFTTSVVPPAIFASLELVCRCP